MTRLLSRFVRDLAHDLAHRHDDVPVPGGVARECTHRLTGVRVDYFASVAPESRFVRVQAVGGAR